MSYEYHPNVKRFITIMQQIDLDRWWRNHPREDFGQAVRRISIAEGNIENDDYPSDAAITIALKLKARYSRKESK